MGMLKRHYFDALNDRGLAYEPARDVQTPQARQQKSLPKIDATSYNAPYNSRVQFPPSVGLLIPKAHIVLDGFHEIVTPKQYEQILNDGRKASEMRCAECSSKVHFRQKHIANGSFEIGAHFVSAEDHDKMCGYHTRKMMKEFNKSSGEYDVTKPYRIHLNFNDELVRAKSLTDHSGLFYERDKDGFPTNESCKDWQPVSIKSLRDLVHFIRESDKTRLHDSMVIMNQQAIPFHEFCLTHDADKAWSEFYRLARKQIIPLRLLFSQKAKLDQPDLFVKPNPNIKRDQFKFKVMSRAGEPKGTIIINPRLETTPSTVNAASEVGMIAILATNMDARLNRLVSDHVRLIDVAIAAGNPDYIATLPDYGEWRISAKTEQNTPRPLPPPPRELVAY